MVHVSVNMRRTILIVISCVFALGLSAQTYKNGVWYSLYDDGEHNLETQGDYETTVFAPTTGSLNVKWRYEWYDLFGAFKKIDTDVLESSNGGSTTRKVGSLQENTGKNSNTTEQFSVSRDINWIKYNRSGLPTHRVVVYHQDLPLAKHILLASGEYGTTSANRDFGVVSIIDSAVDTIKLRSFLSAADITVSCSQPEIFRLGTPDNKDGLVYAVGANACASANGTAATAAGGTLGNIKNYAIPVHFTPKEGKEYSAVITLTDGTSTAKIIVSGIGYKAPQTNYAYSAAICEGDTYPDERFGELTQAGTYVDTIQNVAGGDSVITFTLTVNPVFAYEESLTMRVGDELTWQAQDLSILPEGDTTLVASYHTIFGCDSVYTLQLTILPRPTTYGNDTIYLCAGETAVYDGHTYKRTTIDSVLLSTPNQYEGDSIVELVVYVFPKMKLTASQTIYEGDQQEWEHIDLSQMPIGDTTLTVTYTSIHGCDSIYVLNLTVQERPTTYGYDTIHQCGGESTNDTIYMEGANRFGGDSILYRTTLAHPEVSETEALRITEGDSIEWEGYDLSELPAGETILVANYETEFGCDSIRTLYLLIDEKQDTIPVDPIDPPDDEAIDNCNAVNTATRKIIVNGQLFIRKGDDYYDLFGRKRQ